MFSLVSRYMDKLTIDDVNNFAIKNDVNLSEDELNFSFIFIKKNWDKILSNPNLLNLDKYKDNFSEENFEKISKLFKTYYVKYHKYF